VSIPQEKAMKRFAFALIAATMTLASAVPAQACTDFLLKAQDTTLINGRSMEFAVQLNSTAVAHPRGEAFQSVAPGGKKGLSWTSRYGFVGIAGFDGRGAVDGLNEKGLSLGFLWLPEARYQDIVAGQEGSAVELTDFGPWLLGNFDSVDQIRTALGGVRVWARPDPTLKIIMPLHASIHDASGRSLVVEFLDGRMNIHDNPIGVLTNTPSFPWQMENLRNYVNLSPVDVQPVTVGGVTITTTGHGNGLHGLPGDLTPPSRFVRMVFMTQSAAPVADAQGGVNLAEHLLNAVDIPRGLNRETAKALTGDFTQWALIKDMTNRVFYFRSYENMTLRAIDLKKLDFSPGSGARSIPIYGGVDAVQDVTKRMKQQRQ
jgi:choloylglycine hydrolase